MGYQSAYLTGNQQPASLNPYRQIKWSSHPLFVSDLTNSDILNVLERDNVLTYRRSRENREDFSVINSGCNVYRLSNNPSFIVLY